MIPVVCPTKGRAGNVLTVDSVRPLILCVEESERDRYQEEYPDHELLVHPDSILGLAPKRQWIYEQVGDVFMVDDDLSALVQTYDPDLPSREDPEHAFEIIQSVGAMAKEMGVYLWGLANSHDARYYDANRPFRTTGYVNGYSLGLFAGSRLSFPEDPHCAVEDYYVSGLNAYYYRRIWCDTRWGFQQVETFKGEGGQSAWRTTAHEERWLKELRSLFGTAIQDKVKASTAGRSANRSEKLLRISW